MRSLREYKATVSLILFTAVYDGLAIDVRRQKLYYADAATNNGKVGELSTDGTAHRVLIHDFSSSPRGVAIDVNNRCSPASASLQFY